MPAIGNDSCRSIATADRAKASPRKYSIRYDLENPNQRAVTPLEGWFDSFETQGQACSGCLVLKAIAALRIDF